MKLVLEKKYKNYEFIIIIEINTTCFREKVYKYLIYNT